MINTPVYSDENGMPYVCIYTEDEDGTFRRTQTEPLRLLRDDIKGISISQGEMVSSPYDRQDRDWATPTVSFHYGRPQSFYQFLREKVARNQFFVFAKPVYSGHITKFSLHELQLKPSASQRKIAILKEKYIEALELWSEEECEKHRQQNLSTQTHEAQVNQSQVNKTQVNKSKTAEIIHWRNHDKTNIAQYVVQNNASNNVSNNTPSVAPIPIIAKKDSPRTTPMNIGKEETTQYIDVEQDFRPKKNLVQEFKLKKSTPRSASPAKDQNKHFYKRFIFTIE